MAAHDKPAGNKLMAKPLRYLRALCEATGETTSWPKTRQEASRAIERLKTRPRSDADELREQLDGDGDRSPGASAALPGAEHRSSAGEAAGTREGQLSF